MPRKRYSTEQIVTKLRQAEVELGRGLRTPQVCKKLGVSEQTYYRWRKEYGGLRLDQAKRLKALEQENTRPVNTIGLVVLSRSRECWIVPPASRIYNFRSCPTALRIPSRASPAGVDAEHEAAGGGGGVESPGAAGRARDGAPRHVRVSALQ